MVDNDHGHHYSLLLLLLPTVVISVGVNEKYEEKLNTLNTQRWKNQTINTSEIFSVKSEGSVFLLKGFENFLKEIDFKIIEDELNRIDIKLSLANPNFHSNFEKIPNTEDLFMSQVKNLPAANFLFCSQVGDPVNLQTMIENRVKISHTTMFSDNVVINKDKISCTLHGVLWTDTSCVKQIYNVGLVLGLKTPTNNTREYYSRLVSMQLENSVLYVTLNSTHIWLDNTNSFIICQKQIDVSPKDSKFRSMRIKHYGALGQLLSKWLEHLSTKYSKMMDTFSVLSVKENLPSAASKSNFCKELTHVNMYICKAESPFPSTTSLTFLDKFSKNIMLADSQIIKIHDYVRTHCDNEEKISEVSDLLFILKNLKDRLVSKWEVDTEIYEIFSIIINGAGDKWDIKKCIQETVHKKLTDLEANFYVYLSHNLKVHSILDAKKVLPNLVVPNRLSMIRILEKPSAIVKPHVIHTRETFKSNNLHRSKRWVWTDALSKATGLAKTKDLQGVSDNQQEIRFAQIGEYNCLIINVSVLVQ